MNALAVFAFSPLLLLGCNASPRHENPSPAQKLPPARISVPAFSGSRAMEDLKKQTDFGPRNPGSVGYQKCLAYFQSALSQTADTVLLQRFMYKSYKGDPYSGTNVIARFNRFFGDRILITAHWDTRPWADQDENKENHTRPIPGANDGASGAAVLLELARIFKSNPLPIGVDLVFFDAEDLGISGESESFCQGSQYFAKHLPPDARYRYAINLDMVGDRNLEIKREANSDSYAPALMDDIFSMARSLGIVQFVDQKISGIYDDHMPLNAANIPAIDLIDFDYPDESNRYWHTMEDTADKCSAESLEAVGTVLVNIIYGQRTSR